VELNKTSAVVSTAGHNLNGLDLLQTHMCSSFSFTILSHHRNKHLWRQRSPTISESSRHPERGFSNTNHSL